MSHPEADTKASRCTQEKNLLYPSEIANSVFPVDTLKLKLGSPSNLDILGVRFNVWDVRLQEFLYKIGKKAST